MKTKTREYLKSAAHMGLDLSPGDPNVAEALDYIKALEEFEESVLCFFDDHPKDLPEDVRQALLKINNLRDDE